MQKRKQVTSLVALVVIAILIVVFDQVTKHWVRTTIPEYSSWMPIPWLVKIVTFTHLRNSGAAFGMFPGLGPLFMVVAAGVIIAIIVYYRKLAEESWLLRIAFGLQLGGATGNLIDRLFHDMHVTDFVDFGWWPVFNVADSSVVIGTIILGAFVLFMYDEEADDDGKPALAPGSADGAQSLPE